MTKPEIRKNDESRMSKPEKRFAVSSFGFRHSDFFRISGFVILVLLLCSPTRAAWFDAAWPYRRAVDVTWDAEHSKGDDVASVEFYSAGHHLDGGSDVRVATEDGKLVASQVLMAGPGDRIRVAFSLVKDKKKYYVYWGNPAPPASKLSFVCKRGMLLEMKIFPGGGVNNLRDLKEAFDRADEWVGKAIVDRPFIGNNVLGDQQQTVSKLTGQLFAPIDGEYMFALSADDKGALLIDGKQVVFAHGAPNDIRFNGKINLQRGPHEMVIYHIDFGQDWKLSAGWKRPDAQKVDLINRDSIGYAFGGEAGPLEENKKTLVADFAAEYLGETWYADRFSHRYRFVAYAPKADGAKYAWDFGDGQTASEAKVDHVYLNPGVYPVKLTVRIGANSDTRTNRFYVSRQFQHLVRPMLDDLATQSKLVAKYDQSAMPAGDLARSVFMHQRCNNNDAMEVAAITLAAIKRQPDVETAYSALYEAADSLQDRKGESSAEALWAKVPIDSNLQPRASRQRARSLMWGLGDFQKAVTVLRDDRASGKDVANRRMLAMAMVLSGTVDEGAKVLRDLPEQGDPEKRAAISGAMARTIEYFIQDKDPDSGDDQWEKWQSRYPSDFLLGYSVLLKVKLIEARHNATAAAKLAEAFATAVPKSSYAPQLLNQAAKLLAKTDAKHAGELKALLKQRYPEDPLSQ